MERHSLSHSISRLTGVYYKPLSLRSILHKRSRKLVINILEFIRAYQTLHFKFGFVRKVLVQVVTSLCQLQRPLERVYSTLKIRA